MTEPPPVLHVHAPLRPPGPAPFDDAALEAIAAAVAATPAEQLRLVVHVRRQDWLLELSYLQAVENGVTGSFDSLFPSAAQPVVDYDWLLGRLAALPGVAEVHARPVELTDADRVDTRVYSARGVELAQAMAPHLDTAEDRRKVSQFLREHFAAASAGPPFLSDSAREAILAAYSDANRALFRTWMPDLPEDGYTSVAATQEMIARMQAETRPGPATRSSAPEPIATRAKETLARLAERNPALYYAKVRLLARRCDAFLISFPKCGRTWLRVMLGHALADAAGVKVGNPMRFTKAEVVAPSLPRILATHDDSPQNKPAGAVLRSKRAYRGTKVVFLVRDPRDVIVSLYFHVTRRRGRHYEGTLSDFVRDPNGSLAALLAFYDAWVVQDDTPVLLVRYEAMKDDPARELQRVLDFVGVRGLRPAAVARAVEQASFERLQRAEREGTAGTKALKAPKADDPESFKVRRGKVGGYVDYLTPEDIRFVDAAIAASPGARHLGYSGNDTAAS